MTTKNINLTLSVPPDTRKKLRQLAVDREQSLSEIVIELIETACIHESKIQKNSKRDREITKAAQEAVDNANNS